jgi:EAL domain-containing protein (putative c-di-GMP-specific phosphodiesterase class I)
LRHSPLGEAVPEPVVPVPALAERRHHLAVCTGKKDRDFIREPYAPGALVTLFQPIYRLEGERRHRFGAECLSRGPAGTLLEPASALFRFAREAGTVCSLDRACISLGLRHAATLGPGLVFLNVHPETLRNDIDFPTFLRGAARQYGIPLERIVLELLEYSRIAWNGAARRCRSIGGLRASGVRLALDDVHPNMDDVGRIAEYRPDFIKIDGDVLRGARMEKRYRQFIVAILDLAERLSIEVIAEGLENAGDLNLVKAADISLAQGYYLGVPAPVNERPIDRWRD